MKEIIINKNEDGSKIIALLENGKLLEQYTSTEEEKTIEGNIYCGIVKNVLPGMQAAFVDIGEDKNAFIHIKDIIPKLNQITGNKEEDFSKYNICDYIKQNDKLLVQVRKDEVDKKGARITEHISLTGRLSVLMIDVQFITVSKKIEDKAERERLKNIASKILSKSGKKYGLIIRTGAENKSEQELQDDIEKLIKKWEEINKKYNSIEGKKAQIIYKDENIIGKFITSILETDINQITVNDKDVYEYLKEYITQVGKQNIKLELNQVDNLMEKHELQKQLEKLNNRRVWLNCGGFIAIDKIEALTAIDVNSGKFTGNSKLSRNETILRVNKEATIEIAKQLRLRNLSGIIIIDYIDMENKEDRDIILKLLNEELKKDRSKTQVEGFTKLDLLEMTRKKL